MFTILIFSMVLSYRTDPNWARTWWPNLAVAIASENCTSVELPVKMDWFKRKSTGNHRFS
jgi:hypothetical protein